MGCVVQAKMVFYRIYKNIEFIHIFLKVRLTKVLCNVFPVYYSSISLHPLTTWHVLSTVFWWCLVRPICFIVFGVGPPVVNHVDAYGEAEILRKEEAMFRIIVMLLFTSLDKKIGIIMLCSDNATWIFWNKLESVHF